MIGAVVVLYNPTEDEIKNVNSYVNKVEHTVIVDNSSKSNYDSIKSIISNLDKITYYTAEKNLGLAKGFNIGIDILYNQNCDWVFLLDADSRIKSDIIDVYEKAIENYSSETVAIFAPVHIHERNNDQSFSGYKSISWSMTSGCIYNCKIFKIQEGFFEKLFVDGLDIDYCLKSNENNFKVIKCGEAIIYHKPAETKTLFSFKYGIASPYRYFMQARQLIWCWKRYRNVKMLYVYIYKWVKVLFLFPNKKEYIKGMIRGSKEGYKLIKDWKDKK